MNSWVHIDMNKWINGKKHALFFKVEQLTNVEGMMELENLPFANHRGN